MITSTMSVDTDSWLSCNGDHEPATPDSERLPFAVTELSLIGSAAVFWTGLFWLASYAWPHL